MEKGKIWEARPSKARSFTDNDSKMSLKNLNRAPSLPTMPAGSKQSPEGIVDSILESV